MLFPIVIVCSIVLLFVVLILSNNKELFVNTFPENPLYVKDDLVASKDYQLYTSYEQNDPKTLCPTQFSDTKYKRCSSQSECGPAEVCTDLDGNGPVCVCSIVNKCMSDGIC